MIRVCGPAAERRGAGLGATLRRPLLKVRQLLSPDIVCLTINKQMLHQWSKRR
jgi:hypothetical protein